MTFLQAGTPVAFGSVTSFNLTVPAGVVATDHVLIAVAGVVNVDGANVTGSSPDNPGATFATIAGGAAVFDNTVWGGLIKGTGLVAGNTITVTLSAARQVAAAHYYFDNDFDPPSAFNARVDSATNVAPNVAVTSGAEVFVISLERSTTAGTSITGAVNSHGNTVTPLAFNETPTPTFVTLSLSEVGADPADVDSGTTTLTYTNTSTSGLALTIAESITEFDVDADFSGSGALTAATEGISEVDAGFSGSGALTAAVEGINEVTAAFSGSGSLSAEAEGIPEVAAGFSGSGTLTATTEANGIVDVGAPFSGFGTLSAEIEPSIAVDALFSGEGQLIAEAAPVFDIIALFSGEGDLTAEIEDAGIAAGFSGTGTLTATVDVVDGCAWPIPEPDCCSEWAEASPEQRDRAFALASEFLWGETGRQFGTCIQTVLPCGLACPCSGGPCHLRIDVGDQYEYGFTYRPALLANGQVTNVSCSGCSCCSPCEVALPGTVDSILSVTVDGEVVPPVAYVVYNHKFLARIDGECWPDCQDFGSAPQFLVTYREGVPVPYAGLQAAADLACALLRTCPDLVDCGSCMANEATESTVVSTWIKQVNPHGVAQSADLVIPGQRGVEGSHRQITWSG